MLQSFPSIHSTRRSSLETSVMKDTLARGSRRRASHSIVIAVAVPFRFVEIVDVNVEPAA